jgi:hypothetical protein
MPMTGNAFDAAHEVPSCLRRCMLVEEESEDGQMCGAEIGKLREAKKRGWKEARRDIIDGARKHRWFAECSSGPNCGSAAQLWFTLSRCELMFANAYAPTLVFSCRCEHMGTNRNGVRPIYPAC